MLHVLFWCQTMTPAELSDILERRGIPQTRAAALLGVDGRTVRRWIAGDREIPEVVARVLRMADAGRLSLDELASYGLTVDP